MMNIINLILGLIFIIYLIKFSIIWGYNYNLYGFDYFEKHIKENKLFLILFIFYFPAFLLAIFMVKFGRYKY